MIYAAMLRHCCYAAMVDAIMPPNVTLPLAMPLVEDTPLMHTPVGHWLRYFIAADMSLAVADTMPLRCYVYAMFCRYQSAITLPLRHCYATLTCTQLRDAAYV